MLDVALARLGPATFCRLDALSLVLRSRGSGSNPTAQCWFAVLLVPTSGVTGAAVRARSVTGGIQRLAHEPFRWRPTVLEMALRRYRRTGCGCAWHQGDSCSTAESWAKLS